VKRPLAQPPPHRRGFLPLFFTRPLLHVTFSFQPLRLAHLSVSGSIIFLQCSGTFPNARLPSPTNLAPAGIQICLDPVPDLVSVSPPELSIFFVDDARGGTFRGSQHVDPSSASLFCPSWNHARVVVQAVRVFPRRTDRSSCSFYSFFPLLIRQPRQLGTFCFLLELRFHPGASFSPLQENPPRPVCLFAR